MAEWGEVISITEVKQIGEKNDIVSLYSYRVRTKKGTVFTHLIKEEDTTPEKVAAILKAIAERLDKTASL